MNKPFAIQVPKKFMDDPEIAGFFEYLIEYVSGTQADTAASQTALSNSLNDLYDGTIDFTDDTEGDELVTVSGTEYQSREQSGGTTVAVGGEFIHASNGAVIDLESYPDDGALIKIGNTDGSTIRIRGKSAGGDFTSTSTLQFASYDYQYSANQNGWIIV